MNIEDEIRAAFQREDAHHEVFVVQPKWAWWKEFLDDETNGHEKGCFIRELDLGKSLDEVIDDFYMAHLEANR